LQQLPEMGYRFLFKLRFFLILMGWFGTPLLAQQPDTLLQKLMHSQPEKFDSILKNAERLGVQIIYTQINRDVKNQPILKQFTYRLNAKEYFYPASLVKLPTIALSLEKINRLRKLGYPKLDKTSRLEIDSVFRCQKAVKADTSAANKYPSIAHYAKKMLLVSDNDAYSRLYEFLGQEYINTSLWNKGYTSARVIHRFAPRCDTSASRHTNPFAFFDENGELIYRQPEKINSVQLKNPLDNVKRGEYQRDKHGKILQEPKDFSFSNNLCLQDINDILISLIFPKAVPEKKRFDLSDDDYLFMQKYMSMYPKESHHPIYLQKKGYNDSYKKYFIYGTSVDTIFNPNLRIFNIVGLSYGYAVDCAYIVDFESKTEFFLSAVIYTNKDNLMNGKYQYKTVGMPFMANLGQLILDYEKHRVKPIEPDLKNFMIDYTKEE
jgi:hypothetical protein